MSAEHLSDAEANELEQLEKAATPGPWRLDAEVGKIGSALVGDTQRVSALGDFYANNLLGCDARFIAAARNALPKLLAERRTLKAKLRYDCKGCPGCPNDCPDRVDALFSDNEKLLAERRELEAEVERLDHLLRAILWRDGGA